MSFSYILLRAFDVFEPPGGPLLAAWGGTLVVRLSAFDAAFLLEIPTGQKAWSDVGIHLVLRLTIVWNATAGLLCFVKQDLRPAMEPGV